MSLVERRFLITCPLAALDETNVRQLRRIKSVARPTVPHTAGNGLATSDQRQGGPVSAQPLVSVITPTVTCGPALQRALSAVQRQEYPNLEHVVIGDACAGPALSRLRALAGIGESAVPLRVVNGPDPLPDVATYRPARAAHARTVGAQAALGALLAFLDDDNEYEPHHVSALVEALEERPDLQAVHGWRQIVNADGSPYLAPSSPWESDPERARRDYDGFVAEGGWLPGTNLLRDLLECNTVDSSCWLLRRALLDRVPFRLTYTVAERAARLGEDVAFCLDLQRQGVPVGVVPRHSVRYYLGGFSTSGSRNYTHEP